MAAAGADPRGVASGLDLPNLAIWGNLVIYIMAWGLLMWPQHLPLGRPGIAMVFASMACGLRAFCSMIWPDENYPTVDLWDKVNPTPIALLFGLMLVNTYLKDTGVWQHVGQCIDDASPVAMLVKVCLCSAAMSAVLLNDTTCFVLTPAVLDLCNRREVRNKLPFLLAVSMSSNIGSSLTIIGNPQNALIASLSPDITFLGFASAMLAPVAAGLALNTAALWFWFRHELAAQDEAAAAMADLEVAGAVPSSASSAGAEQARAVASGAGADEASGPAACDGLGHAMDRAASAGLRHAMDVVRTESPAHCRGRTPSSTEREASATSTLAISRGSVIYVVAVGVVFSSMLTGWFVGLSTAEVALAAGSMLMLARALRRRWSGEAGGTETDFGLGAIDYSILILFVGQFILVGATVDTGLPQKLFLRVLGTCAKNLVRSAGCVLWFAGIVLVLSNLISNVPVILMLEPVLDSQPSSGSEMWVVCAWVATAAGNLTMLGSAANLIVAHVAEGRGETCFTATDFGTFTLVPTVIVTILGVLLMPPISPCWVWTFPCELAAVVGVVLVARKSWRVYCAAGERALPPAGPALDKEPSSRSATSTAAGTSTSGSLAP